MGAACKFAVVFPSEASLYSAISSCDGVDRHQLPHSGRTIFTVKYAENVRVAMTAGYSKTLEAELAMFCDKDPDVIVLYPALFAEMLQLTCGSAHRLEICKHASRNATSVRGGNVSNLVAGLFQSAAPASVNEMLTSSRYHVLFPSTWVNNPIQVDGIVSSTCSPLFFDHFVRLKVYHVAVCTGKAEKMASAKMYDFLDVNSRYVCNFIRVAVMAILQHIERNNSMERAIHLAADLSVPNALIYSHDDNVKRMLPIPNNILVLEKNQRVVQEFFVQHVPCLDNLLDIRHFAIELIGEEGLARAENSIRERPMCGRELIYQIYLQWKKQDGNQLDFVPLVQVFEKLGLTELKDRCEMFVAEHSFRFKLHQLDCFPCFVEQ